MDFWELLSLLGQQYPSLIPLLSKPGVFDVMSQAVNDNWPATRLQSALEATPYFQQTPQDQRTFDVLVATDPASAHQKVSEADKVVRQVQGSLGIPDQGFGDQLGIAIQAAAQDWDATRIKMEVVARTSGATQIGPGGIGDQMTTYQGIAHDYGVPINHNDLYWWAANTQGGSVSPEGFHDFVTEQAMNLLPALKPALEQGMSVKQYATAYLQQASNELGINPNQIDLLNPKWTETFLGTNDAGEQRVLNLNESLQKVRSDPAFGYDSGTPAVTQAANFAAQLQQKFGATG